MAIFPVMPSSLKQPHTLDPNKAVVWFVHAVFRWIKTCNLDILELVATGYLIQFIHRQLCLLLVIFVSLGCVDLVNSRGLIIDSADSRECAPSYPIESNLGINVTRGTQTFRIANAPDLAF